MRRRIPVPPETYMHIQYSWTPDAPWMRRSVRAQARRRLRQYHVLAVLYALLGVAAFAVDAVTRGDPALVAIGLVFLVAAGLYRVLPTLIVRRVADRQLKLAGIPTTVTITDEGIASVTAVCRISWSWAAFDGVQTVPGYWMLRVNGVNAVVLDQSDLSSDQLTEVRAFLAERGLVPATYRVS